MSHRPSRPPLMVYLGGSSRLSPSSSAGLWWGRADRNSLCGWAGALPPVQAVERRRPAVMHGTARFAWLGVHKASNPCRAWCSTSHAGSAVLPQPAAAAVEQGGLSSTTCVLTSLGSALPGRYRCHAGSSQSPCVHVAF